MPTIQLALVPVSLIAISFIWVAIANAEVIDVPAVSVDPIEATITPAIVTVPTVASTSEIIISTQSSNGKTITEARMPGRVLLSARAQNRIINLAANISNRFEAATGRLQNISDRLTTRAAKIAETGADTSAAVTLLQTTNTTLDRVRSSLRTIDASVADTVQGADARNNWQVTREQFSIIRTDLVSAHAGLRQVIALLKNPVLVTATSSADVIE